MSTALPPLIQQYKADSESVYNTWFINNEERLKAFRSIRRGVQQVVKDPGQDLDERDFTSLREKPLYEEAPGDFVLIHSVLMVEMLHKGLHFQFSRLNNDLPDAEQVSEWRPVYCDFFSEQYLLNDLLDASFQGRGRALSGTIIKDSKTLKGQGEPDYYFRHGQRAILFESKVRWSS